MACKLLTIGDSLPLFAVGRCSHVLNNTGICYNKYVSGCPIAGLLNELPKITSPAAAACDHGTSAAWNQAALEDSFRNMPRCVPMPVMTPADLNDQVHENTVKSLKAQPGPTPGDLELAPKKTLDERISEGNEKETNGNVMKELGQYPIKKSAEPKKDATGGIPGPAVGHKKASEKVREELAKRIEQIEKKPERTKVTDTKKTPGPIPADFEKKLFAYIKDNPKAKTSDIRDYFNVTTGSLAYYLKRLMKNGVIESLRVSNNTKDGSCYRVIGELIPEIKPEEKKPIVPEKTKEVFNELHGYETAAKTLTEKKPAVPPAIQEEIKKVEPAASEISGNIRKLIKEVIHMNNGPEKDRKMRELIVEILKEQPGMSLTNLAERLNMSTQTLRNYLLDLEESKKIERRMMPIEGSLNSKTGYFAKGAC